MRISTSQFHQRALDSLFSQQDALSRTQNQIATGKRIQTPADDPIGAVHILELQRAQSELDQFKRNSDAATARLTVAEQALGDSGLILQRVRELVVQANSGVIDDTARAAISIELQQRASELLDIANRRDGNGEFLFSGYATTTQPFARIGASVTYAGDQGGRVLQVAPTQRIADGDSGFSVFQNVTQGNGTFVTAANVANTGSGSIDTGQVVNAGAWVPQTYTITFVAPDSYQITNSVPTTIVPAAPGNFAAGSAISFNGVQVKIDGAPATGDKFTVATSQKEDIFTSIDKVIAALAPSVTSAPQRAQLTTKLAGALQQLDQADSHLINVRTDVGARLSTLDSTSTARQDLSVDLQAAVSKLSDVDYADAISRLTRQQLGLQAAQQSYANISKLSLFNYL